MSVHRACAHWIHGCDQLAALDGHDNWWLCEACRALQAGERRINWASCTCNRCPSR